MNNVAVFSQHFPSKPVCSSFNCSGAFLGLPIRTSAPSAGAIVFCIFGTLILCSKDRAVKMEIGLELEATAEQIFRDGGERAEVPYKYTYHVS